MSSNYPILDALRCNKNTNQFKFELWQNPCYTRPVARDQDLEFGCRRKRFLEKETTLMLKKSSAILALATSLIAGSALADTDHTSTLSAKTVAPKLIDKLTISYLNVFYGPSIAEPIARVQPDSTTGALDPSSPLLMKNYLSVGYKINDRLTLSPTAYWLWEPVEPHTFTIRDPYVRLSNSKFLSSGKLNVAADVRLAAPVSEASRDVNRITTIASKQIATYELGKVTAGVVTYGAFHLQTKSLTSAGKGAKNLEFYAGPNVEYKLLPTLSATLLYEVGMSHLQGASLGSFNNDGTDLEPGLSWDITPSINFSPFLDFKTGQRVAADTTTLGAVLTWKLL